MIPPTGAPGFWYDWTSRDHRALRRMFDERPAGPDRPSEEVDRSKFPPLAISQLPSTIAFPWQSARLIRAHIDHLTDRVEIESSAAAGRVLAWWPEVLESIRSGTQLPAPRPGPSSDPTNETVDWDAAVDWCLLAELGRRGALDHRDSGLQPEAVAEAIGNARIAAVKRVDSAWFGVYEFHKAQHEDARRTAGASDAQVGALWERIEGFALIPDAADELHAEVNKARDPSRPELRNNPVPLDVITSRVATTLSLEDVSPHTATSELVTACSSTQELFDVARALGSELCRRQWVQLIAERSYHGPSQPDCGMPQAMQGLSDATTGAVDVVTAMGTARQGRPTVGIRDDRRVDFASEHLLGEKGVSRNVPLVRAAWGLACLRLAGFAQPASPSMERYVQMKLDEVNQRPLVLGRRPLTLSEKRNLLRKDHGDSALHAAVMFVAAHGRLQTLDGVRAALETTAHAFTQYSQMGPTSAFTRSAMTAAREDLRAVVTRHPQMWWNRGKVGDAPSVVPALDLGLTLH